MPIFIAKILSADFLPNFKVAEFEHELEPGDLGASFNLPNQWKSKDKANEQDLQNKEKIGSKKSSRKKYSLIRTPQSRDDGEFPHKNALSLS